MQNTTNFNLKKPDYTDFADIQDINDNMDTLDTALKATQDRLVLSATTDHAYVTSGLDDSTGEPCIGLVGYNNNGHYYSLGLNKDIVNFGIDGTNVTYFDIASADGSVEWTGTGGTQRYNTLVKKGPVVSLSINVYNLAANSHTAYGSYWEVPEAFRPRGTRYINGYFVRQDNGVITPCMYAVNHDGSVDVSFGSAYVSQFFFAGTYLI